VALDKEKVKNTVKNNFKISVEKYFEFESKYNFFYNLAVALGNFLNIKANEKILDVGCGYGVSCKALTDKFKCVSIGIDLSDTMIEFGKKLYENIEFHIGDGEKLSDFYKHEEFDKVVYNASIFIFPDTFHSFLDAKDILKCGGWLGFSHYPEIISVSGENLFDIAFERAGYEKPRRKVISTLETCMENLKKASFDNLQKKDFSIKLDVDFLKKFFKIPAQSASLFPKMPYEQRAENVDNLFETLRKEQGVISWAMVKACKTFGN
jgi:SAM-dependent methyltransferase